MQSKIKIKVFIAVALALSLLLLNGVRFVSAQLVHTTRINVARPRAVYDRQGNVRSTEALPVDVSGGVQSGSGLTPTDTPYPQPNPTAQTVPSFSAINSPYWVTAPNQNGAAASAQITAPVISHGIVDARVGLMNSTGSVTAASGSVNQTSGSSRPSAPVVPPTLPPSLQSAVVLDLNLDQRQAPYADTSGSNNHVTQGRGASSTVAGIGRALRFEPAIGVTTDYIKIPAAQADATLNFAAPLSIEMWIKPELARQNQTDQVLVSKAVGGYFTGTVYNFALDPQFKLEYFAQGGWRKSNFSVTPGQWNHVAMTLNNNILKFYLDGREEVINGVTAQSPRTGTDFVIGASAADTNANPYRGLMDEVKMYRGVLTPQDIQNRYTSTRNLLLPEQNPEVLHLNFDQTSGDFSDISGNSNHASVITGIDRIAGGLNRAVRFDPNSGASADYAQIPAVTASRDLNLNEFFTIEGWVKPAAGKGTRRSLIAKGDGTNFSYHLELTPDNKLAFYNGRTWYTAVTDVMPGNWYHVAATLTHNTLNLYVNGIEQVFNNVQPGVLTASPVTFGAWSATYGYPYYGLMDEMKLYDGVLSAQDILTHYQNQQPTLSTQNSGSAGAVVLDLDFDEAQGTFTDGSGNNNDITTNRGANQIVSGINKAVKFLPDISVATDYLEIAAAQADSTLNFGTPLSMEMWINPDTATQYPPEQTLVSKAVGGYFGGYVYDIGLDSQLKLSYNWMHGFKKSARAVTPGQWNHVAMSLNNGTLKFYINGQEETITGVQAQTPRAGTHVVIGASAFDTNTFGYRGLLDELKIYNTELSASDVRVHYAQQRALVTGNQAPELLHLNLDQTSGTFLDSGSYTNHTNIIYNVDRVAGGIGRSVRFDPTGNVSDYLEINTPSSIADLNVYENMTLEAWVKPAPGRALYRDIISKGDGTNFTYRLSLTPGNKLAFFQGGTSWIVGTKDVHAGNWNHVAMTITQTSLTFYVNGVAETFNNVRSGTSMPNAVVTFGATAATHANPYYGLIDELRILDGVLPSGALSQRFSAYNAQLNGLGQNPGAQGALVVDLTLDDRQAPYADASGNSNHMTQERGVGSAVAGIGRALRFEPAFGVAADYIKIPAAQADATLNFAAPLSIEMWIKPETARPGQNDQMLVSKAVGGYYRSSVYDFMLDSQFKLAYLSLNGMKKSAFAAMPGQWNHVAMTLNNGTLTFYLNGQAEAITGVNAQNTRTGTDFVIGAWAGDTNANPYRGLMDEVKIYNTVLSASEVQASYNTTRTLVLPEQNPEILNLNVNQAAGDFTDASGNAHDVSVFSGIERVAEGIGGAVRFYPAPGVAADYMEVPAAVALADLNVFEFMTFESWIKPAPGKGGARTIVSKGDGMNFAYQLAVSPTNKLAYYSSASQQWTQSTADILPGHWTHVAMSVTHNTLKLYVNGVEEVFNNARTGVPMSNAAVTFGATSGTRANPFFGEMDDIKIYDGIRSAQNIASSYSSTAAQFTAANRGSAGALMAHLNLDQGQLPYIDSTGFGNYGTQARNVYSTSSGVNGSLRFWRAGTTQNGYVIIPPNQADSTLDFSSPFSVEMWIKPDVHTSSSGYQALISKPNSSYGNAFALDPRLRLAYWGGSWQSATNLRVTPAVWSHVALTYNNGTIKYYLNGQEEVMTGQATFSPRIGTDIVLGAWAGDINTMGYKGLMDEVKIYNYVLTRQEIQQHHGAVSPVAYSEQEELRQIASEPGIFGFLGAKARAQTQAYTSSSTLLPSPLVITDDLYVAGARAAEPGNLTADGSLLLGQVGLRHTIRGDARIVSGDLTVAGGKISASGNITGRVIGDTYTQMSALTTINSSSWSTPLTASCRPNEGDELISCAAHFSETVNLPANGIEWLPTISGDTCSVRARLSSPRASEQAQVKAVAVCFSSD